MLCVYHAQTVLVTACASRALSGAMRRSVELSLDPLRLPLQPCRYRPHQIYSGLVESDKVYQISSEEIESAQQNAAICVMAHLHQNREYSDEMSCKFSSELLLHNCTLVSMEAVHQDRGLVARERVENHL